MDPSANLDMKVTPSPNENLRLRRLKQLRTWISVGTCSMILISLVENKNKKSNWDYIKFFLDFCVVGTGLNSYVSNNELKHILFPPSVFMILRMIIHLVFAF